MNFFQNKNWFNFITSFFPKIEFTNELLTELHHHESFSRRGFVHNDYDPVMFLKEKPYDGLETMCRNSTGGAPCDNPNSGRHVVRSAAVIYYVGYGPKVDKSKPAGGHTAFFKDYNIDNPVECIEPIENRLLIFTTNPISFHASRTNNSTYRDSIYNWFHSEMDFMQKIYPNTDICKNQR